MTLVVNPSDEVEPEPEIDTLSRMRYDDDYEDAALAYALHASELEFGQALSAPASNGSRANDISWHGTLGDPSWPAPTLAASSEEDARPGYAAYSASEYLDNHAVMQAKVKILADLVRQEASNIAGGVVVYTGAGISTAAGVPDYASRASTSQAPHLQALGANRPSKTGRLGGLAAVGSGNRLETKPTLAHAALAGMESKGLIQHWLQQNHDRLAQKAGYPQSKLNEIHGAWGDHYNSVVQMSDSLRPDLAEWMAAWCQRASLVLALGTTLCGMNSDQVAQECAVRFQQGQWRGGSSHGGLVIVNLQRTRMDGLSSLRIWGLLDVVLGLLSKELGIRLPEPQTVKRGEEWQHGHPACKYNTPKRKQRDPL